MIADAGLSCPSCRRRLRKTDWIDERSGRCEACRSEFEALTFPALTKTRSVVKPQVIAGTDESTCFFHAENQAEAVCDGCGRFLCAVCAIPSPGGRFCPSCVAAKKTKAETAIPSRVLYDGIAFWLAIMAIPAVVVPFFGWLFSIVAGPATIGVIIFGWKKPASIVHGARRWRLILAGVLALALMTGWTFMIANMWLH